MPLEFVDVITPEHYYSLMGFAGICAAFLVGVVLSRGL